MGFLGGHLGGSSVSALVDGQLDAEAADRAWAHVLRCPECRRLVEREGWIKRQLAGMGSNEPSARLLDSLYELTPSSQPSWEGLEAWAAVDAIEHRGRARRRTGIALVGAGSVSAALFGVAAISGALPGFGGGTAGTPASSLTRPAQPVTRGSTPTPAEVAPVAVVHGTLRGWRFDGDSSGGTASRVVDVSPH